MDLIIIRDLEAWFRVGVTDAERASPQRLLLTLSIETDFAEAARTDEIQATIDYYAVSRWVLSFAARQDWRLIEKLARELGQELVREFGASAVTVEVKKFVVQEADHVAVRTRVAAA